MASAVNIPNAISEFDSSGQSTLTIATNESVSVEVHEFDSPENACAACPPGQYSQSTPTIATNESVLDSIHEFDSPENSCATCPSHQYRQSTQSIVTNDKKCGACIRKDYVIWEQKETIRDLRKKLKKANDKIWYLENIKRKLDTAFSELKKQNLLNEELCKVLEVRMHFFQL